MAISNFEQIRAKNALEAAPKIGLGKEGGRSVAKKVPAQIVQDGFLGALAFAIENVSNENPEDGWYKNGYANTFVAIRRHLVSIGKDCGIGDDKDIKSFMSSLCEKSARELRMITEEALCYLNYLRRFAKPGKDENKEE